MNKTQDTTPGLAEQYADIFFQLFRYGLNYPPSMTPGMAEHYGRSMGHYGRLALAERAIAQHQRNQAHLAEVARAFATLQPQGAHLGAVEG